MSDIMNITRQQFEEAIAEAVEAGRAEERIRARGAANRAMAGNKLQVIDRYLHGNGWAPVAIKETGREWVDSSGRHRIGVPNKVTKTTWDTILVALANYYRKSEKAIESEILSYGKKGG